MPHLKKLRTMSSWLADWETSFMWINTLADAPSLSLGIWFEGFSLIFRNQSMTHISTPLPPPPVPGWLCQVYDLTTSPPPPRMYVLLYTTVTQTHKRKDLAQVWPSLPFPLPPTQVIGPRHLPPRIGLNVRPIRLLIRTLLLTAGRGYIFTSCVGGLGPRATICLFLFYTASSVYSSFFLSFAASSCHLLVALVTSCFFLSPLNSSTSFFHFLLSPVTSYLLFLACF
jgi:hypothetical protein